MNVDAASVFLVLFVVALGLTILSLMSGATELSIPGLDSDVDVSPDGVDVHSPSVFNLPTMLPFLTWFSGVAYAVHGIAGVPLVLSVLVATVVGLAGAGLVFLFLMRVVWPGQTPYMADEAYDPVGQIGRLSIGVRSDGTGELVYSQAGTRRVLSARSERGEAIARGTEVVVVRYARLDGNDHRDERAGALAASAGDSVR